MAVASSVVGRGALLKSMVMSNKDQIHVRIEPKISDPLRVEITTSPDEAKHAKETRGYARKSVTQAIIQNCITTGGFVAAIISGLLVWKTLDDTNANFYSDKRPWIGPSMPQDVDTVRTLFKIPEEGTASWLMPWKNFGNSPAIEVTQHSSLGLIDHGGDRPVALTDREWQTLKLQMETLGTLAGTGQAVFPSQAFPNAGSVQSALANQARFEKGLVIPVVLARVIYYDTLSKHRHETTFCFKINPPSEGYPLGWEACPFAQKAE